MVRMTVGLILAFGLQQSGLLVPKIPILYRIKKQTPEMRRLCPGCTPAAPPPLGHAGSPPEKDTVSSWEQDFVEDHFCHDAPDRPDVHYQTPGD